MTADLRTPIPHDPLVPYAVVAAENGRVLARFADSGEAVDYAEGREGLPVDTTPLLPPTEPGWYSSGREPIDTPFAGHQPLHLDEVGDWYRASEAGLRKLAMSEVVKLMPLRPLAVAQ